MTLPRWRWLLLGVAVVIMWPGSLWAVGYSGSTQNNANSRAGCLETTAIRYEDAQADDADYTRELVLEATAKTEQERDAHGASAEAHQAARDTKLERTAPTDERREAYCKRLYPRPGFLGLDG